MKITWSPICVSRLDLIKIAYIVSVRLNAMPIVVYGDLQFLVFCLPISVHLNYEFGYWITGNCSTYQSIQ